MAFRDDQIGKVNVNPVGEYGAECLLVVGRTQAKSDKHGFNLVQGANGAFYRAVNVETGEGIYGAVEMGATDLEGVAVEPYQRPPLLYIHPLPPLVDVYHFSGGTFKVLPDGQVEITGEAMFRAERIREDG